MPKKDVQNDPKQESKVGDGHYTPMKDLELKDDIKYPICPICLKQTVAGACLTSKEPYKRSIYCVNPECSYDVPFEVLTTPIKNHILEEE
jgi:hypothetical protein